MDSEECAPGPPLQNQTQHHHQNPPGGGSGGRSRKRGGGMDVMSSSVETVAPHQHHDKVLRSHTRRGRVVGGLPPVAPTVISSTLASVSRRRQRSSCCSSHTDEDDGGGGIGSEERGRLGGEGATASNNNNNKGLGEALLIPSAAATSSCFAPTNETKELCEQAGLLGGTTKTTTIHSGGTRLSSSCIPQHNELTTQQCQSNNAGEHSSSVSTSDNVAGANSSQKINVVIMDNNSASCSNSRRSRQHGNHNHHRSTPPAADAGDDDNVQRRNESGDDNDDDEMCQEDAASCELPGKPRTATTPTSSANAAITKAHHSISSLVVGTIAPSTQTTTTAATTLVKSEFSVCGNESGGGGKGIEESCGNRRACRKEKQESVICESVTVKREIERSGGGEGGTCDLTGVATSGGKTGNKIDGGQDGKWSGGGGEFARQDGEKSGERRKHSNSSVFSSCGDGGASMPQESGLIFGSDGDKFAAPVVVGTEEITSNKVCARSVKKCASGAGGANNRNKKQLQSGTCYSNNNNSGQNSKSVGSSVGGERKKALVPAPMLLMNNLPYMGELTFDTRPRRGRKPKKADICHLITKNYGIQFPAGVAQAACLPAPLITASKPAQQFSSTSHNKKTTVRNETVTVTKNVSTSSSSSSSSRNLVPPTFCNRDVSIVPIIPTSWGGVSSANSSPMLSLPITTDTKCSPSSSTANLLKPLSSLAQQLMLHHHQQLHNPLPHGSPSSSRSMTSAAMQQTISMFPLPTPSPFSHTQHSLSSSRKSERSKACEDDGSDEDNVGDEEDDNLMEVDIQSAGGQERDNQDCPLNLCMRDKTIVVSSPSLSLVKEESLDVRWSRGGGGGGSTKSAMVRSSNSYSSDGAKDSSGCLLIGGGGGNSSNKRSMISSSSKTSSSMKGGKSAKLSGSTSQTSNISVVTNSSSSSGNSDSVSNLVNRRPIPSPFGNVQQPSKLSPNIFAISAHHLQPHGGKDNATGKAGTGGKGKQSGQSRKKKEMNLRGDVSISAAGSPGSQSASGATSTPLSSFGGTLFGQSTAGINDGAEVSICKFKFTGGAKPCLQEKKMLSVDSGGNFRFYSDKTTGTGASGGGGGGGAGSTGKLAGKGQQLSHQQFSSSSSNAGGMRMDLCQSPSSTDGVECHYALSSLPKSAKSMSMCMPQGAVNNSGIQVQSSSMSALMSTKSSSASSKMSLPLIQSPTSSSSGVNPYASLSLSPTTEELQQLHLSMQDQVQRANSSSRVSPYPSGDYSFSSSNSCSSSDNGFGGDAPSSSSTKSGRQATSANSHHYTTSGSSGKMKLKRKRRTRKSLMREKLEKTFKEKGFLIQTQQLESAEGATYCKFRQLRKFTRYLFRSWKDYLPDHVKEISDNNATNGVIPGTDQANSNNPQPGQRGDDSNVQSLADDDGDLDEEDEEEDAEDDDEIDSEEQQRQGLISLENTIKKNTADEESFDDEEEVFKGSSSRSRRRKQGAKGMSPSSTSTATGKTVAAPVETKVKVENDFESSSNDVNDMGNDEEEIELQVDV